MRISFYKLISALLLLSLSSFTLFGDNVMENYLSLYDFNSNNNKPEYQWEDFTDQVMGGKSEMSTGIMQENGRLFLRMKGDVSLKNNGGFIQTRLKLASGLSTFDASDYDGIRLRTRGKGSGYYLFFRTSSTILPWLYYSVEINADEEWQTVNIPWSEVTKGAYGSMGGFKPSKLKSVALVAFGREFSPQIDLSEIGLYKN